MKNSSFKLLQRLFQKDKPILLGRWGSVNSVRNSELSNHDHCGTCPTKLVGPYTNNVDLETPAWKPEQCKQSSCDSTTDMYYSVYEEKNK
jgi:hypothetical protein